MRFVRNPFFWTLLSSTFIHGAVYLLFSQRLYFADTPPHPIGMERGTFSIALVSSVAAAEKLPELILDALPPPPPLPTPRMDEPLPPKLETPPERLRLLDATTLLTEAPSRPTPTETPFPLLSQPDKPPPEVAKVPEKVIEPTPEKPPEQKPEKPPEKVAEKPPEKKPEKPAETASKESVASVGSKASSGAAVDELPSTYYNPTPPYPADALTAGVGGLVTLWVKVGADGRVESAEIHESSGRKSLDESALSTVKRWTFYPARRKGVAVAQEVEVPIRFVIRNHFRYGSE
jgi:periplasmic protein TonB